MQLLYTIGISFFGWGIRIASLVNPKAKAWVDGRKELYKNLPATEGKTVIWFHCASLGEFDQGLPLMEIVKREQPECFLLVTFFSPSGMQFQHKRKHSADHVMYIGLDTPRNARKFINHFQPDLSFFVKYEFWSNHIFAAKRAGTKLYNISGLFRQDHRFFKWYGGYFRKTLAQFDGFFVQNEASAKLLQGIDITNVSVSGDNRFDRVLENKRAVTENKVLAAFKNNERMLVIGSSWPEDEKLLAPWIKSLEVKVLLAPHNVDKVHVDAICSMLPEAVRYTQSEDAELANCRVLILDTIGQLANAYSYGEIAYVGGGFSGNLHNILEPAVFGLPVIFGPKHHRFPEGQQFIDRGIGWSVSTAEELDSAYRQILENHSEIQARTTAFVEENKGAAQKIWNSITPN